jgi:hypothetical protein
MKMGSINILIENLVEKDNDEYIQMLFEKDRKGKDITGGYKKDSVPENKLLNLLENSTKDERIQCLLNVILRAENINEDSVSDKVFEYCLNYPGEWKRTLLILLAHMRLKKEQLKQLIGEEIIPEAFYQLFFINLRDNDLQISQFRDFLLEYENHLSLLANFQEHTEGKNINQDKIDLANQLVREQLKEDIQSYANTMFHHSEGLFILNLYDDNLSVSQFREFLLENEKYFIGRLADCKKDLEYSRRKNICQEKINLVDQLLNLQYS